MEKHYVYILLCNDNTLYTGYTNDIEKRFEAHSKNKGAKYTRGRGPFKIVYLCVYESKSEAMQNEYAIKQLSRAEKNKIIDVNKLWKY